MAIDPRNLRPGELCRLLNSTPLGTVISERQLYRHRTRAGLRLGEGNRIDLLKYVAWLVEEVHKPREAAASTDYEVLKERARARNAAIARAGRDIGELPGVVDSDRRQRAAESFQTFCEAYFPRTFHLAFSDDHRKVIAKIEEAVLYGGLFALAMPRGSGKALALDTPLVTPFGWTTMGKVQVGDLLFDEEGWPCCVTYATDVQLDRPCYRVDFSDGESIVCDADHLWTVEDRYSCRNPLTLTTQEMEPRVIVSHNRLWAEHRYRVPMTEPLRCPEAPLDVDPYILGYWLGDGARSTNTVTVHTNDAAEVAAEFERLGETCRISEPVDNVVTIVVGKGHCADSVRCNMRPSLRVRLRVLKVLLRKHIPEKYLRAAPWQRLALLQGLMDTDGSIGRNGHCEITLKDDQLAHDLGELLSSLGFKWRRQQRYVHRDGRRYGPYLRYHFTACSDFPVFRLSRKRARLQPRPAKGGTALNRYIVAITPVASVPVRCIQVDSPSSLYLAGKKMVPTHNTTIAECACLWAILFGHREFVALIGASEAHAEEMLESIKMELDGNDLLLEDFPEAVFPIHCLDGIANRCAGQLHDGERTHIVWTAREIVLPTITGSRASGAVIRVAGITGRIRGMKFKRPDGQTVRPSLVVLDDPQTDESARSPSQCAARESILAGAVLGLAGPGRKISGIMPCTVIRPEDMADRILDREKHPQWQGQRTKMVYSFPTNEKLWAQYAQVRADSLRQEKGLSEATLFYREHQDAMDAGSVIAWPERFNQDEASAIQHAMNLRLQNEAAFFAEYQNEPLPEQTGENDLLTADQICVKTNGQPRGLIPLGCSHLTMFVDVQQKLLYWLVCAWEDDFTGHVVDYGSYPDQRRQYFTLRDSTRTLATVAKGTGLEGAIYAGLETLIGEQLSRRWHREDGTELQVERCLIDANWGSSTDVVYQFCRQSRHSGSLLPSHGRFVGAASRPFSEHKRKPGERIGLNWRITTTVGKRAIRHVLFDTNFWKSFVHARLVVSQGDPGCLSLFESIPEQHRLLAEHLTAEYRIRTEGRGRTVDEWKIRPEQSDNHWLDCLVGCAVAAAAQGCVLFGTEAPEAPRKKISLSRIQKQR